MTGMELVHVPGYGRSQSGRKNPRGRPSAARKLEIEQRRLQVAALILARVSGREIARRLGLSYGVVCDDVKAIKRAWRDRTSAMYQERVDEEEAKLDWLERAFLPRAIVGETKAAEMILKVADRRAKLIGLDQPTKVEAKVEHVEVEQRRARATELIDEVARRREQRTA